MLGLFKKTAAFHSVRQISFIALPLLRFPDLYSFVSLMADEIFAHEKCSDVVLLSIALKLQYIHSVLALYGQNANPLIILSTLPCLSQKRLKMPRRYIVCSQKVSQMSNTCHASGLGKSSVAISSIQLRLNSITFRISNA